MIDRGLILPGDIDYMHPVNFSHPLNKGLVGWWIVLPNMRGGLRWIDIARRNDGTLTNMDPATDWVAGGRPGGWGALDFDGDDDEVTLFGTEGYEPADFQWYLWFRPSNVTGTKMLLTKTTTSGGTESWGEIRLNGAALEAKATGGGAAVSIASAVEANQWCFCAVSFRTTFGNAISAWAWSPAGGWKSVDGGAEPKVSTAQPWRIGARSDGFSNFLGQIDSVLTTERFVLNAAALEPFAKRHFYESRQSYPGLLSRIPAWYYGPVAAAGGVFTRHGFRSLNEGVNTFPNLILV